MLCSRSLFLKRALVALSLLALGACSSLRQEVSQSGDGVDYKSVKKTRSLDVPPDLTPVAPDARYTVPARASATASSVQASRETPQAVAGASAVLPVNPKVEIKREGVDRWLVVNQPPEWVWARAKKFWGDGGFNLETESPETGVMETEWAENRAKLPQDFVRRTLGSVIDSLYDTGERDRFRTRLERNGSSTEVRISHRGLTQEYTDKVLKDGVVWRPRANDPQLEAEFLRRMSIAMGGSATEASNAEKAGAEGSVRARLVDEAPSEPHIALGSTFDRSWRNVGVALDRMAFTVEDRDRVRGVFFVRYVDDADSSTPKEKPGFFGRMFSSDAPEKKAVKLAVRLSTGAEPTKVSVQTPDGKNVDRALAIRVLNVLLPSLI